MRELEEKRRGTSEHLYLAQHRTGSLGASDTMPDTVGGEGVMGPLNRMP
jgi:hypothetical protein